ncbi:hypothetical protein [Marilutibacter alkalisoli]|uniref:Protein sip-5 n=1 Tax=Marilutibacter alkalisoli TaxID=2591633 RepID=A0A514BV29_9GAMM|nr:hypothetical protein [Lysobacter alkalisoli]QDH71165.1 hypothetical protein FKV23_14520 [Lysobacter alkalisoli]
MKFQTLQRRVERREHLLDARVGKARDCAGELKQSWRSAWTPGRIVIAGLVAGFVAGRAEPLRYAAQSGDLVKLVSMISSLFAAGAATEAADVAKQATDSAAAPGAPSGGAAPPRRVPAA